MINLLLIGAEGLRDNLREALSSKGIGVEWLEAVPKARDYSGVECLIVDTACARGFDLLEELASVPPLPTHSMRIAILAGDAGVERLAGIPVDDQFRNSDHAPLEPALLCVRVEQLLVRRRRRIAEAQRLAALAQAAKERQEERNLTPATS